MGKQGLYPRAGVAPHSSIRCVTQKPLAWKGEGPREHASCSRSPYCTASPAGDTTYQTLPTPCPVVSPACLSLAK